jgi:hypothetical protein
MRTVFIATLFGVFSFAALPANGAPPAAPQVTVGSDIKQLIFDWDSTAGASYYRLMQRVGSGSFRPLIDNIPASNTRVTLSVAVHLHSWSLLRYAVAACNAEGCTLSNTVFPQGLMTDAIGYFKASNTGTGDAFGHAAVLSDDGRTLAVAARHEDSNASGVNGNQSDNSSPDSGAVYVYRRVTSGWRQEAYLKAGINQPGQMFGSASFFGRGALAVNGNGTLVAVGAPDQTIDGVLRAGAVYVYQRATSGSWSLVATLQSPEPSRVELFGYQLDMSLDGRTLKVSSFGTWTAPDGNPWFRSYVFVRPGTTWLHSATIAGVVDGDYCETTRLSRDGMTVVAICDNFYTPFRIETFKRSGDTWGLASMQPFGFFALGTGLALDANAQTMALGESLFQQPQVVGIYRWTGASWSRQTGLAVSNGLPASDDMSSALLMSRTGNLVAMARRSHNEVQVWKQDLNTGSWLRRAVVRSPGSSTSDNFASAVGMCGTGHALAIGAEADTSGATGIDGNRMDTSAPGSGAVYLY